MLAALLRVVHRLGDEAEVTIYASDLREWRGLHFSSQTHLMCVLSPLSLAESAMEVIEKNVALNASTLGKIAPQPLVLDWEDEPLPAEISEGVHLVVYVSVFLCFSFTVH